jgi:hypothetical protein
MMRRETMTVLFRATAAVAISLLSAPPAALAQAYPDVTKILGAQTLDPMPMTPDEFAQRLKSDYEKYERIIKATGARAQ